MTPYYQDDAVTIYHGDCREVLPGLPKVDLVLTDPPYGIGFAAQPTKWQRLAGQKPEAWDGDCDRVLVAALVPISERLIIWGGNYFGLPPLKSWLTWYKPDAPPSMGQCEHAWTNLPTNTRMISCSISSTNPERLGHPTQKPLRVMAWCISLCPDDPQTILDPFMGSGTTLRAAKDLQRKAIGIEIEERYCEIAAKRMAQEVLAL